MSLINFINRLFSLEKFIWKSLTKSSTPLRPEPKVANNTLGLTKSSKTLREIKRK